MFFSFSGTRPNNLGSHDGQLAPCPNSPNCVCSQSPPSDANHYIPPFPLKSLPAEAIASIQAIVESMERTKVITATDTYLYAEFTSALMGYIDDVEFLADNANQLIHVRSASRLGQSDLGVNRKRIESIRSALMA